MLSYETNERRKKATQNEKKKRIKTKQKNAPRKEARIKKECQFEYFVGRTQAQFPDTNTREWPQRRL